MHPTFELIQAAKGTTRCHSPSAATADAAAAAGRRGSNVCEVNQWLWQFGRGKPRLGGLSVEETAERMQVHRDESHKRAVETRRRRKADRT